MPTTDRALENPAAPPDRPVPALGTMSEVAPGLFWARLPLPFSLNHVNIYLADEHDGWTVIDTGIADAPSRDAWEALLQGPMGGRRISRLILTHHHPDHLGLAGWLADRFAASIHMTDTEYLLAQHIHFNPQFFEEENYRVFYRRHGMSDEYAAVVISQGHLYKRSTTALPWTYHQLTSGGELRIGRRRFEIITGGGHSPDQAMLYCRDEGLFISADQVMLRISPNVSVTATNPEDNPLGAYLRSPERLRLTIRGDALVLPGHHVPFKDLHGRIAELATHHADRCTTILTACSERPHSAAELVPLLFRRELDAHQMSFAFSETLAHVNLMIDDGRLAPIDTAVQRVVARR